VYRETIVEKQTRVITLGLRSLIVVTREIGGRDVITGGRGRVVSLGLDKKERRRDRVRRKIKIKARKATACS